MFLLLSDHDLHSHINLFNLVFLLYFWGRNLILLKVLLLAEFYVLHPELDLGYLASLRL